MSRTTLMAQNDQITAARLQPFRQSNFCAFPADPVVTQPGFGRTVTLLANRVAVAILGIICRIWEISFEIVYLDLLCLYLGWQPGNRFHGGALGAAPCDCSKVLLALLTLDSV